MIQNSQMAANNYSCRVNVNDGQAGQLPKEIISKIVAITSRGSDATIKRKKDGYSVYETKLYEK